jgi:hypothetical protein
MNGLVACNHFKMDFSKEEAPLLLLAATIKDFALDD